jgi:hypothetical protein
MEIHYRSVLNHSYAPTASRCSQLFLSAKTCIDNPFGLGDDIVGGTILQIDWVLSQCARRAWRKDRRSPALTKGLTLIPQPLYSIVDMDCHAA